MTDHVTAGNSQTLGYDALDRLHTAPGGYGSETFGYDANGNRNSLNGTSRTYAANSNRLTAMGTTSVTTNANGSITGIAGSPATGFTYYKSGRLDTVTSGSGTALTYTYDAFGRRATKVDTAQRFYQYAFDDKVLEESDNTYTTKLDTIYLDGMPVATFVPNGSTGTLSFLHTGTNDIPRLATNASQGTGWSFTTADPFAGGTATVSSISNDLRYPGQEYEMATGQFYNRNRDYAPGWGRYLESDPIGLNGGQVSTYAYGGQNPLGFVDPSGLNTYCPSNLDPESARACYPKAPEGYKPYGMGLIKGPYHCNGQSWLEYRSDLSSAASDPVSECVYDPLGNLITDSHPYAMCKGTPDQNPVYGFSTLPNLYPHMTTDTGGPNGKTSTGENLGDAAKRETERYQNDMRSDPAGTLRQLIDYGNGNLRSLPINNFPPQRSVPAR